MPTYIMLTTLTPEGVQTVKNNPNRIKEVSKEIEQLGATVHASSPAEFKDYIAQEMALWGKVVRDSKISATE